jgi:PncC family amidohydrolase
MQDLLPIAGKLGALLKDRHETIAIAESSTGGLISAALLAVPGASAYFLGGAIVYTRESRRTLLDIPDSAFAGIRGVTEPLAQVLARGSSARSRWKQAAAIESLTCAPSQPPRSICWRKASRHRRQPVPERARLLDLEED